MYVLKSLVTGDDLGSFERVADAVHRAIEFSFPTEEFEIYNDKGERVAAVIAPDRELPL